ncbi:MAG: flagellar hook-basal body complex protein FliE [Geobacteraceae bacterium]|nr:flagellar hook-basal body complex protein FliE [Geobacteraceae bacterium]
MVIKGIDGNMGVGGISGQLSTGNRRNAGNTSPVEGFTQLLGDMVNKVNDLQNQADTAVQKLATGESKGLHEVMISMEKSSISFQFLTQVRNKALDAYHEIMRMQI